MEGVGGREAADVRLEVVLGDGSTAAAYRLAHPWERCADSGGGGAAVAEATAALAALAVSAQAAPPVARLLLTIAHAGTTRSISLLPRGADVVEASSSKGNSSISLELHPTESRALVRLFNIAGSRKKWASTLFYEMCIEQNFYSSSTEQVFGKEIVYFHAMRCERLPFPPFELDMACDFNILKQLGKGSEGKVFKCSSKFSEYTCAIKEVIPADLMITSTNIEPSDVSILAELNHPNVVKLHLAWNGKGKDYFGRSADLTFTSMEFFDRTLLTYLEGNSTIELDTANQIFRQMMMGLEHAHLHHIVHHDLKPDNILMDADCNVMIADFGVAQKKETPTSKLKAGILGSLPYCAPEVKIFHNVHDEKADIFSAGIIYLELYILATAHRERKVQDFSRVIRKAMSRWEPWTEFDLDAALQGTGLLDDWAGDFSLLKLMLHPDETKRASASDILAKLPGTNTTENFERN